jgi:hypothetical protein
VGWEDIDIQEVEREEHIAEMLDEKDKQRTVEADSSSNEGVPPTLPNRPEFTTTNDPLGSNSDLMRPRDALFDEALTANKKTHKDFAASSLNARNYLEVSTSGKGML